MATLAQYYRLHVPVTATETDVIREAHARFMRREARFSGAFRAARHAFLRDLLQIHRDAAAQAAMYRF